MTEPRIEPATLEDIPHLTDLLLDLFRQERDFLPDPIRQARGLRLIIETPNRGRIFVLRDDAGRILGMVNLLFTISTAEGGFVIILEDLIVHPSYRCQGYGTQLLQHAISFARAKNFLRITLLTDQGEEGARVFYSKSGFTPSQMIPMRLKIETAASRPPGALT